MELKDRWVFFVFLLLILFTLLVTRGEKSADEKVAPRAGMRPPAQFSRDAPVSKAIEDQAFVFHRREEMKYGD